MHRYHIALVGFLMVLATSPAAGQEVPSVTLDEALRLFAENNLELRVARSRADEAAGRSRQAGAFPNPSFNASHEPLSGQARSYSETYLTASQRFEISGSRGARMQAGDRRLDMALALLRADSARLAFEAKSAYVETAVAQELRDLTGRVAEVFREATRSAAERFEAGDVSLYELRRIRIERARYETLLADADLDVGSRQRTLALLVAPAGDARRLAAEPLESATPPPVAAAVLAAATVEGRAELAAARADFQAQEADMRLVRAERIPDVTATGGLKTQSDGLRGGFFGLSVPVPLFDRGVGSVQAGDAAARAAAQRLDLTRRRLENDVLQAIEAYEAIRRRFGLVTQETAWESLDLLDVALVAYAEGEMDLVELLDAADALHQATIAEVRLGAALWIAHFDLERALGGFETPSSTEDGR